MSAREAAATKLREIMRETEAWEYAEMFGIHNLSPKVPYLLLQEIVELLEDDEAQRQTERARYWKNRSRHAESVLDAHDVDFDPPLSYGDDITFLPELQPGYVPGPGEGTVRTRGGSYIVSSAEGLRPTVPGSKEGKSQEVRDAIHRALEPSEPEEGKAS